ncbi:hypothetical protein Z052_08785 [Halorubrum sp. C191]|nr:hypothetical protein Z052_08785 [Halorubrum sp. C191]
MDSSIGCHRLQLFGDSVWVSKRDTGGKVVSLEEVSRTLPVIWTRDDQHRLVAGADKVGEL